MSDQARQFEQQQLSAALGLLRNQPNIGLEADPCVRERLVQGGDMEGARKIVQEELEKSGLFSVDIGGQSVTPAEWADHAKETFVGQGAPESHRV